MSDLRFKWEVFMALCDCPASKPDENNPRHYDWCKAVEAAEIAQSIYGDHLAGLPVVHGKKYEHNALPRPDRWFEDGVFRRNDDDTHTARLDAIEPIDGGG